MPYQAIPRNAVLLSFIVYSLLFLTSCKQVENKENTGVQTLSYTTFTGSVNAVFDANIGGKTCSATGCHNISGGSGGSFKIYANATTTSELTANFISAKSFANLVDPASSKLLLEPLTGIFSSVGSHAGGDIFTKGDANYTIIFNWINSPITP